MTIFDLGSRLLIPTIGLPGSGKTTRAIDLCAGLVLEGLPAVRLSRDQIRKEFGIVAHGEKGVGTRSQEDAVTIEVDIRTRAFFHGKAAAVLVADATNLTPWSLYHLVDLAREVEAGVVVKDLRTVPVEECVRRDAARTPSVGADVIRELARRHGLGTP